MRVAGLDGCRRGWVAVVITQDDFAAASLQVITDLERGLDRLGLDLALIDVPIGLGTRDRPRQADQAARRALPGRTSSVFSAPCREALSARTHREACTTNAAHIGKGLSQQAFHIMPKIAEVDALLTRRPDLALAEGHPEVSFALVGGRPMSAGKKSAPGRAERTDVLAGIGLNLGEDRLASVRKAAAQAGCRLGRDDLLDAAILAWSAGRVATGAHRSFPATAQADATGLPMAILA